MVALLIFVFFLVPCLAPAQMLSRQQAETPTLLNETSQLTYIEPGPTQKSTLYADGSTIDLQTQTVTWPILLNETITMTQQQFKELVKTVKNNFDNDPHKITIDEGGRGLDLQFTVSNPPSGAQAAINTVATYIESLFSDPVTAVITLGFESMGSGILGSTSSAYASSVTWANTRAGLIADMDSDDTIQSYLPSGSTIPIRYNGNSGTVTNENRCYFTKANYRAAIGTVTGNAADMSINTDYNWDFDPSNGITSGYFCFQTVLAHEVGHVLGFTSGADFRYILQDIETLDIYRFQRSDGAGDYNPDTLAEFQTTARMVDQNAPGTSDDVNSDIISEEYQMSDGEPYQCSHFSQGNVQGIMQPAVSSGSTYYPDFYKTSDKTMLDAIGWNYIVPPDTTPPVTTASLSGTLGKNGWYVSDVTVTLDATDPPEKFCNGGGTGIGPSGVNHTYYKIDSGPWNEYLTPFVLSAEGQHTVWYYSTDNAGNIELQKSVAVKIDKTVPTITLTKQEISIIEIKFTADVSDAVSGIDRVEFALDGVLQSTDTQAPYEWTWTGIGEYSVTATVFDKAGHSQSQSMSLSVASIQAIKSVQFRVVHLMTN